MVATTTAERSEPKDRLTACYKKMAPALRSARAKDVMVVMH
jgi:hypothetical protein